MHKLNKDQELTTITNLHLTTETSQTVKIKILYLKISTKSSPSPKVKEYLIRKFTVNWTLWIKILTLNSAPSLRPSKTCSTKSVSCTKLFLASSKKKTIKAWLRREWAIKTTIFIKEPKSRWLEMFSTICWQWLVIRAKTPSFKKWVRI